MDIYVQPDKVGDLADKCSSYKNKLDSIETRFNSISRSLDWDVRAKANINIVIKNLNARLNAAESTLNKHYKFLKNAENEYREAETYEQNKTEELKNDLYQSAGQSGSGNGSSGGSSNGESKEIDWSSIIKLIKYILPGVIPGVIPHLIINVDPLKFLGEFGKKLISNVIKSAAKGLSELGKYAWSEAFSLISGVTSIGFKISDYYNKYINGIECTSAFVVDTIGTGASAIGKWISSVMKMDEYIKASKGLDAYKGFNSTSFSAYTGILGAEFKFATTALNDIKTLSADGEYSMTDFGETMVDASISGLFRVGTTAIGIINPYAGAAAEAYVTASGLDSSASEAVKNWAYDLANDGATGNLKGVGETITYNALYGIGWAATTAFEAGSNVVTGVTDFVSSIFK